MPRHFRMCRFCPNTSMKSGIPFFRASDKIRQTYNLQKESYICAKHFDSNDIITRGNIKKIRDGVLPHSIDPDKNAPVEEGVTIVNLDIDSMPLDLVIYL